MKNKMTPVEANLIEKNYLTIDQKHIPKKTHKLTTPGILLNFVWILQMKNLI